MLFIKVISCRTLGSVETLSCLTEIGPNQPEFVNLESNNKHDLLIIIKQFIYIYKYILWKLNRDEIRCIC